MSRVGQKAHGSMEESAGDGFMKRLVKERGDKSASYKEEARYGQMRHKLQDLKMSSRDPAFLRKGIQSAVVKIGAEWGCQSY